MIFLGYEVEEKLFESYRSIVYRTRPVEGQKSYILKVLKNPDQNQQWIIGYKQEFTFAQAISADITVRAKELLQKDGNVGILFEDFSGETLESHVKGGAVSIDNGLEIALQLTEKLGRIHEAGIVHKDISPANILWNSSGRELRIIDFGISSFLSQEQQMVYEAGNMEGTLPFMSPEQTGRMNRVLDYRTDFYSLGMTLFHLFTGTLPCTSKEPLEVIHFHLARTIEDPALIRPDLPKVVSAILRKLVAKSAEDRYQTAYGLYKDLLECREQYQEHGAVEPFSLAEHDVSDRFSISQILYGRENEVQELISTFSRIAQGRVEMVFVAGYSGVGKTSLVNEVHKPITSRKGIFVSGKFDQYQRNVPYSAFINVFNQLIDQVLYQPPEKLVRYKSLLKEALGSHAGVFANLVPNIELLLGEQESEDDLGPVELQNLFNQLTKSFIHVFASAEHPLVIFIDDFQWADLASLKMLGVVLNDPQMSHLLLIGSYRDNEVDDSHPLILTKKKLEEVVTSSTITLKPLLENHVSELVGDTFHVLGEDGDSVVSVLMDKTLGNPFFINQLLTQFVDDGVISYHTAEHRWNWDAKVIGNYQISDNVADLMLHRLSKLPEETRELMKIASCVGQRISLNWLSIISNQDLSYVAEHLWPIIETGLMVPMDGSGNQIKMLQKEIAPAGESASNQILVKFLHDRVQQAAYSLIASEEQSNIHLKIGRKLLGFLSQEELGDSIFTVVSQFNAAEVSHLTENERLDMSALNLSAAIKAKETLAYHTAIELLGSGLAMQGEDLWKKQYTLSYNLAFERAECRYYVADLETAEKEFLSILEVAERNIDKAKVYRLLVDLYTTKGEIEKAVRAAISGCALIGVTLYLRPTREQVLEVYGRIQAVLGDREISSLVNLPEMSDPEMEVALSILAGMMPPALFFDENLLYLEHCLMVEISLRYGNAPPSASGYSYFGMILGCMLGKFEEGFEFGKLGYNLLGKKGYEKYRAKVCLSFGSNVNFWVNHVVSDLRYLEEGFKAAVEWGDITYSCYHCNHIVMVNLASGMHLDEVYEDAEKRKEYVSTTGYTEIVDIIESKQRLVKVLQGRTLDHSSYSDIEFSEGEFEQHLETNMSITVCWYYIHKTQARYTFGLHEEAIAAAKVAEDLIWSSVAHVELPEHYLYYSLALAAVYREKSSQEQVEIRQQLKDYCGYFEKWMGSCTDNFEHKYHLVRGELHRIEGEQLKALICYERAIDTARSGGFIQLQALGHELALRLCIEEGLSKSGYNHLRDALRLYKNWGADGKVVHLEGEFAYLEGKYLSDRNGDSSHSSQRGSVLSGSEGLADSIDYATIVNISQAIATRIDMDSLLVQIMKYSLENTGAEKASIARVSDGEIVLEVYADEETVKSGLITSNIRERVFDFVSEGIILYVERTGKQLVIDNAYNQGAFVNDSYVTANKCKSILCMPFHSDKDQKRFLFLENSQMAGAFPQKRVETLALILPQVAISIENAKLFEDLQMQQRVLQESEEKLRSIIQNSVDAIGVLGESGHTLVNPAYLSLFDYDSLDELLEVGVEELVVPEKRGEIVKYLKNIARSGTTLSKSLQISGLRKNGVTVDLELNASRFGSSGQELTLVIIRDVSERKVLESRIRQSQKMEAIGNLAGGIAHDFNNILTAILGYAEMAKVSNRSREVQERYLNQILLSGNRAKVLIQQILAFSRYSNAEEIEAVNLEIVLHEVVDMLRATLPTTIEISTDIEGEVGFALGNSAQFHQVLMNLSTNSYHAMESQGGKLTLSLNSVTVTGDTLPPGEELQPGKYLRLSVTDTGEGIPEDVYEKIFDPYFTTKETGKGTGMGLAIVHGIVKSFKGFIQCQSKLGRGTSFHIYFPEIVTEGQLRSDESLETVSSGSGTILFVDDEQVLREMAQEMLQELGYSVISCSRGEDALELFEEQGEGLDLVITDQTMPGITGDELATQLLKIRPDLPIIICTGYSNRITEERAKLLGVRELMMKPWTRSDLGAKVHEVLGDKQKGNRV